MLLDVFMPGMTGLEALPPLAAAAPDALTVMLTSTDDPEVLQTAGATTAVIDKACDLDDLVRLLGDLTRGRGQVVRPCARV